MANKVMQHPWLWKRFAKGNETDYVPAEGELVISAPEINSADLRLGDGVTPKGNKISVGNFLYGPIKPALETPVAGTETTPYPQLTANTYAWILSDGSKAPHISTDWQLARDTDFTDIIFESLEDTQNLTTIDLYAMGVEMVGGESYYVRLRYRSSEGTSPWSEVVQLAVEVPLAELPVASFSIPDVTTSENYGGDVAVSDNGQVAVVGAYYYGNNNGKIYIYEKDDNGNWQYVSGHEPSDRSGSSNFGFCVAINQDGSMIYAGQPGDDESGSDQGAVYVFSKNEWGSWEEIFKLTPNGARNRARFGMTIEVTPDGSRLLVGATGDTNGSVGDDHGAVYVFDWDGASYVQQARLLVAGIPEDRSLGSAIAIRNDGKVFVAGCNINAYVYTFTEDENGNWSHSDRMVTPDDVGDGYYFGNVLSLSADGGVLAITARTKPLGEVAGAGAVFIYNKDENGDWEPVTELHAPVTGANNYFGYDAKLTGDGKTLMVSQYKVSTSTAFLREILIYQDTGNSDWEYHSALTLADIAYVTKFYKLDITPDGSTVIVGEPGWKNTDGVTVGQMHIFE